MFGPLAFKDSHSQPEETQCLICLSKFNLDLCLPLYLKHIFDVHKIVIEDAQNIDNLQSYLIYWRDKFKTTPIEQIVPAVVISPTDSKYFVLSTLLKDDKHLRHKLKLEAMLKQQEFERTDTTFSMSCLFCKLTFQGKRCDYITHLSSDHNVRLGNPQNLVYIDELLKVISEKQENLLCLYCEKTFTDRNTLKDHMRKKLHKRINPSNKLYDKYFAANYLEEDHLHNSNAQDLTKSTENSDDEYADWNEVEDMITCLYCNYTGGDINKVCLHMNSKHKFNFYDVSKHFDFYQKVKLVNYIRRQIHRTQCVYCDVSFENLDSLRIHMNELQHCRMPDVKVFDQPEFYFPTFENDTFLHHLEYIDD